MDDHWLARPSSIRLLWRIFLAVLAAAVLAELGVAHEAHFGFEEIFGFGAWYGFLACAALILVAKAIGAVLKRPDTYYGEGGDG